MIRVGMTVVALVVAGMLSVSAALAAEVKKGGGTAGEAKKGGAWRDPAATFDAMEKTAGHDPLKGELTKEEFVKALEKADAQMGKWGNQLFDRATKADPNKITKDEWVKFMKEFASGGMKGGGTAAKGAKKAGGPWGDPAAGFDALEKTVGHEPLKGELTKEEFVKALEKSNAQMGKWAKQLFDQATKADPNKITKDEWVKSRKEAAAGGKKGGLKKGGVKEAGVKPLQ
jgi:hypothetical protein